MTRKEFETFRLLVEKEKFTQMASDPLDYGIQRIEFRRQKLKKLISAGKEIDSRTVQAKIARWKRQLSRLEASENRLAGLKSDISGSKLRIEAPQLPLAALPISRDKEPRSIAATS